ncbi:MAG: hypothetical protein ABSA14_08345 [Acidimicrobiales bacterium]|jgi:hypothetical protein
MRFRTGFVVGCAAGVYLTRKARQVHAPIASRQRSAPTLEWVGRSSPSVRAAELKAEKMLALGDLARERASDLLRGPVGNLARERVVAIFESAVSPRRSEAARRT